MATAERGLCGGFNSSIVKLARLRISELLKKNKKIAITANSHKVIHNLLEKIESLAVKQKFIFKGLKMGNPDNDDTSPKSNS